jgi:hypothetical protein
MGFTWAQKQLLRGVRGARVAVAWDLRGAAMGPTSENNILLVVGTCVGGARLVWFLCKIRMGLIWDSHGLRMELVMGLTYGSRRPRMFLTRGPHVA